MAVPAPLPKPDSPSALAPSGETAATDAADATAATGVNAPSDEQSTEQSDAANDEPSGEASDAALNAAQSEALSDALGDSADDTNDDTASDTTSETTSVAPDVAPSPAPSRLLKLSGLPRDRAVLSKADVVRYTQIFQMDGERDWARVNALIKQLDDPVLLGYVLADRYLGDHHHSTYDELAHWLAQYSDLPEADKIYTLALKRRHARDPAPTHPDRISLKRPQYLSESRVPTRASAHARREVHAIQRRVRIWLSREMPTRSHDYVESSKSQRILTDLESDEISAWIANSYFLAHVDDKAYEIAHGVAERHRNQLPLADWTAGLAAWRLGKIDIARHHFEAMAHAHNLSRWNRTAGAYWAARANLIAGAPQKVSENLKIAASEPTTFYGLLALRQLGQRPRFNWHLPSVSPQDYARALSIPSVRRAVALGQIGEIDRADQEMRRGHALAPPDLDNALISLSAQYDLAGAQLHVAEVSDTKGLDGALYPIPPYEPAEGFTVDRALIYAFMRQESRFKPQAKSGAGAAGLMQLMPTTAAHVAGDRSLRYGNRDRLYDPAYNLSLAQSYIDRLMKFVEPKGNLFMLAASYNGGPGNALRWSKAMDDDDPLMFIESIPARETRVYVERVLANLWLYRYRMGEGVPSLDEVAQGRWPLYNKEEPKAIAAGSGAIAKTAALAAETQ